MLRNKETHKKLRNNLPLNARVLLQCFLHEMKTTKFNNSPTLLHLRHNVLSYHKMSSFLKMVIEVIDTQDI